MFAFSLVAQTSPITQALTEFHHGQYAAARQHLQEILKHDPANPQVRLFLTLTRAATGECESVLNDLAAQFSSANDHDLRRLTGLALVQCHLAKDRYDAAIPILTQLQTLFPGDADVLYEAARLHRKAWNAAVFQMFQKTPASYRVNQLSAEVFETEGKYGDAISEYRKAIAKNPSALNLHFRLGRALLMNGHGPETLAQARQEFEAELALNSSDSVAEYQIGQVLTAEQKAADAAPHYENALALSPDFPEALIAVAKLRAAAKQYPDAIRLLERAVALQPANEAARYNLMMAYRNAGRTADALRQKNELDKLQRPPEGEFTEFLKKLGEKPRP